MIHRRTTGEKIFDALNILMMLMLVVITIYPFLHILAISLNESRDAAAGGIGVWPRKLSFDSYEAVMQSSGIYNAMGVSIARALLGTILSLLISSMTGYALMDSRMRFFKGIYRFFVISMFISGGLIPNFLLYRGLGLYDNFLVYILPGAFSVFNMIMFRTYMLQLPHELVESAVMDGAGDIRIYTRIILPLCLPILATLALFVTVWQWNSWQDTLYFTKSQRLETLQYVLMRILRQAEAASMTRKIRSSLRRTISVTPESIKMAITMVATVPILLVYPFLQRFFIKGIVLGAVKG